MCGASGACVLTARRIMDCSRQQQQQPAKCLMLSFYSFSFLFLFLCAWSAANAEGEIIFRIDPLGKQRNNYNNNNSNNNNN